MVVVQNALTAFSGPATAKASAETAKLRVSRIENNTTISHNARANRLERREARQPATASSNVRPQSLRLTSKELDKDAWKGSRASLTPASANPERTMLFGFFKMKTSAPKNSMQMTEKQLQP